ncbi:MAG: hypothetical protein ACI92E_003207 [Oceanicoccus sp.]|jgi:hypothetical protein
MPEWFKIQMTHFGVEPEEDRFHFKRIDKKAELDIGGIAIQCVLFYDYLYTDSAGVSGKLGAVGSDADIGVLASLPHLSTAEHTATLKVDCLYVDAGGVNVGATIKGRDSSLAPPVIMTPRSGWWSCASERGGGIACLLEMMRTIKISGSQRDVMFTVNTGHELNYIGLGHYLSQRRDLIRNAHRWIHFYHTGKSIFLSSLQ